MSAIKQIVIMSCAGLSVLACDALSRHVRADEVTELPLVFKEDFSKGRTRWETTDDEAWDLIP